MQTSTTNASSRPAALFLLSTAWIVLALGVGRETAAGVPAVWADLTRIAVDAVVLACEELAAKKRGGRA